jgi:L-arabinose isomerase
LLYVTTYALSSTVLPVVQRAKVPVIILNLQPAAAIDYEAFNAMGDRARMTGEWLAYCSACPVPEIANVLRRSGIPFHQVTGMLEDDPICWEEIQAWIDAARGASDTTTASARTPYAIDWILVPDEWRINAKNVVRSPASDHWPVFMEVQVGF